MTNKDDETLLKWIYENNKEVVKILSDEPWQRHMIVKCKKKVEEINDHIEAIKGFK